MFHNSIFSLVLFVSAFHAFASSFSWISSSLKAPGGLTESYILAKEMFHEFINQYVEDRTNNLEMNDALVSGFTKAFRKTLRPEVPLFSIEDAYPDLGVYFCTNFGQVGDLKTIRKIDKNKLDWHEDGSVSLTVFYELEDFKLTYGTFYLETPVKIISGNISVRYKTNRFAVEMMFIDFNRAVKSLNDGDVTQAGCLIYVKNFRWENLGDHEVTIESGTILDYKDALSKLVTRMIDNHHSHMVNVMQKQVLMELYNMLPMIPVCRHENFNKVASAYEADKPRTFSPKYREKCSAKWVAPPTTTVKDAAMGVANNVATNVYKRFQQFKNQ